MSQLAEEIPWQRLSERAAETKRTIAPKVAEGQTHEEIARELGIDRREVARAMKELEQELRALVEGATLPPLTAEEQEALRESLRRVGQLVPVLVDEHGKVLDGEHRMRLLASDGIQVETRTIDTDGDPELAHEIKLAANTVRRSLSAAARRAAIEAELLRDPQRSDRAIAALLGISHHVVASIRAAAEADGKVLRLEKRVGRDGKKQAARKPPRETPEPAERPYDAVVEETLWLNPNDTTGGRLGYVGKHLQVHISEHSWLTLDRPLGLKVSVTAEGR